METRKVQITGGNTYIVSLPKKWVKAAGIKSGDSLRIIPQRDGTLVIEPETGQTLNEGEEGELVFTTLNREAMPLIRYRTHDLSRLITGRCSCGAILKRIDKVTRRIESIIRLGEEDEIYPALFDDVLYQIPEVIDYQATLDKKGSQDCLVIRVEMIKGMSGRVEDAISSLAPIQRNLEAGSMAKPEVQIVAQGTLTKVSRAKKLISDRRGLSD